MAEAFNNNLTMLKAYMGSGFIFVLYAAAFVYLLIRERSRWRRLVLVYAPLIMLIVIISPPFRMLYERVLHDGATYYRFMWLVPVGMTIAYAAATASSSHRAAGLAVSCVLVVFCGSLVYKSPYITKAENAYHIPQHVIDICDIITPNEEGVRVMAAFPSELTYFVRQYDTDIMMPFGRDMVEVQWDYYNDVYEVMELPEVIDMDELDRALGESACSYLVLWGERQRDKTPESLGYRLIDTVNGYEIWETSKTTTN